MRKKLYIIPTIEYIGVESETLMLTATAARTTTNHEASTGQQGGNPIPQSGYADEGDVGAKESPFLFDENYSVWND
jgi:hypothetical protein